MDTPEQVGKLHRLFDHNFMEYTSYVIKERAIPDINDGLKPVQRRILQTLFNMDDGRFQKVANVVGESMKLHPHGDASIFGALVNLANKGYLIDRQGNFGNIYTGDQASAPRYIECRLTPLAKETLFNKDITEFIPSYDGRLQEPVTLPAKLPFLLLHGAEGIAVGMATKIMPHNFCELLEAQIKLLKQEEIELYPDFPQGGLLDISAYDHGNGRLKSRAKIVEVNDKTIHIKELPYNTTTESLIDSVEKATRAGKIKIVSINDYTAEEVEIEIKLARGVYAKDTIKALYAFSDCEVSISPNLMLIKDNNPINLSVEEVLAYNTEKLVGDLTRELEIDLGRLKEKLHLRTLERIFIEERIYKRIEECTSQKAINDTVTQGLEPFAKELQRPLSREDVEHLLEIRIKRISLFDLKKQRKEITEIKKSIKTVQTHLKDMVSFTISYLKGMLKKYGPSFPRRTELTTFKEVEARKVALSNLTVGYHRETGLLGHQVKTDCDVAIPCSEYDRLFLIYKDGRYKVINVVDKIFVGHDLFWADKMPDDPKTTFNMVYRDGRQTLVYVKRFHTPKFIIGREYRLFPEHKKSAILFFKTGEGLRLRVDFMPSPRSKTNSTRVLLDDFLIKGVGAIGKRLSNRSVRRLTELAAQLAMDEEGAGEEKALPESAEIKGPEPVPDKQKKVEVPADGSEPEKKKGGDSAQLSLFQTRKKE